MATARSHQHSVKNGLALNATSRCPTYHLARNQIYDNSQIKPPLPGTNVSDIRTHAL